MGSEGILETIILDFEKRIMGNHMFVKMEFVVDFIKTLQEKEYDSHIAIMGTNGNGKSFLMLEIMKRIDPYSINSGQIVYAFNNTSQLISMLKKQQRTVIGIDELKKFFHYRESSTTESIVLVNMIEYARSHRLAIVGCCNDIRRINSNYRNAKVQMVIWILDRYDDDEIGKSYGLVFVGNPALEEDDKFMIDRFKNIYSFEEIRLVAESLPTFHGYLLIDDIYQSVTSQELSTYLKQKEQGIRAEADRFMKKLDHKQKRSWEETVKEDGDEKIDELKRRYPTHSNKELLLDFGEVLKTRGTSFSKLDSSIKEYIMHTLGEEVENE
jgi:hypothetical protein